ncbi:MAG TPA: cytochrome c biogenesis protein ResB, partial [Syntrophorhabdaceae bacterium]|nr:cytochrome c biogenesis protein ResB [Syntrophorhabdaceae bacterium]
MKKQNETTYNPVWRALSSIRTSIVLLILIAASSVVGTLVPQGNDASTLVQHLNPVLVNVLIKFGFFDMYHSLWFRMLILIFALNLTACSLSRFRSTLALFRLRARIDDVPSAGIKIERNLSADVKPEDVSSAIGTLLRRKYRNLKKTERESGEVLYVEKGRLSLFSVYIVHSSILMVLLGAFIGSISGFEGYMTIPEGET